MRCGGRADYAVARPPYGLTYRCQYKNTTGRLKRERVGVSFPVMLKSAVRLLITLFVVFAVAIPASARFMPISAAATPVVGSMTGMAAGQPCPACPRPDQPGSSIPYKMLLCPAMACVAAPTLPTSPTLLSRRVVFRMDYGWPAPAHLAGINLAPEPFPPKSILLL